MNLWPNHIQWWVIDFQAPATLLLAGTLLGVRRIRQPAQRLAVVWATSLALVFLCLVAAVPLWPGFHTVFHIVERPRLDALPPVAKPLARETAAKNLLRVTGRKTAAAKPVDSALPPHLGLGPKRAAFKVPAVATAPVSSWPSWLFLLGSAGACVWLLIGMVETVWLRWTATPAPGKWTQDLRIVMGSARPLPRLLLSSRVNNAVALGILRPTILLPASVGTQVNENSLKAVLAHESAHIRSGHLRLLGLLRALLLVLFPNPLYWVMRHIVRTNQEAVADALAAQTHGDDYAGSLIEWMRQVTTPERVRAAAAVGIWEEPSELSRRIAMLIDEHFTVQPTVRVRWRAGAAALVGSAALGLSLLTIRPVLAQAPHPHGQATVQLAFSPGADALESVYKQAAALENAGKLADAEAQLNRLLAQTKGAAAPVLRLHALELRGDVRARMGKFQDAVSDFEQTVRMDPGDDNQWCRLALLLARTGNVAKYRACCKQMVHSFGGTTDAPTAIRVAKSCLAMPSALGAEELVPAERLADTAMALTPPGEFFPWRSMTTALAEYRRGEFARAGAILAGILPAMGQVNGWFSCKADVWFISAMTRQQLKQSNEARAAFERGRQLVRSKLPAPGGKDLSSDWWDVIFANMLMSEAGKTIERPTPSQR